MIESLGRCLFISDFEVESPLSPEDSLRTSKHFLHPTMKVRSLVEEDVDYINDQITKVTIGEYLFVVQFRKFVLSGFRSPDCPTVLTAACRTWVTPGTARSLASTRLRDR